MAGGDISETITALGTFERSSKTLRLLAAWIPPGENPSRLPRIEHKSVCLQHGWKNPLFEACSVAMLWTSV
jgi:hypothetical protein